jgi:hypothetical protein
MIGIEQPFGSSATMANFPSAILVLDPPNAARSGRCIVPGGCSRACERCWGTRSVVKLVICADAR